MTRNTLKLKILLEQDRRIFKSTDLALLWQIENRNTLLTTIKRYVARGILHPIKKGLYATVPIEKLHPFELGCAVCGSLSYVTTETVLQKEGLITQNVPTITLMGSKSSKFSFNHHDYFCRYVNSRFLINRIGITDDTKYSIANTGRAVVDLRHVDPNYYIDNALAEKKLKMNEIKGSVGYS